MQTRIKAIIFFVTLCFSIYSIAGSFDQYEGKLISYNNTDFKVELLMKNGNGVKSQEKYFSKKFLSEGQIEELAKLLGKNIKFRVPLVVKK